MSEVKRATRVAGQLRAELARMLPTLRDPRLAGVLVTTVELTDDLQLARVLVRHLHDVDDAGRAELLRGLKTAKSAIRRGIAATLRMRHVPDIRFFYDEGLDHARRIQDLLSEIEVERTARPPEEQAREEDALGAPQPAAASKRP